MRRIQRFLATLLIGCFVMGNMPAIAQAESTEIVTIKDGVGYVDATSADSFEEVQTAVTEAYTESAVTSFVVSGPATNVFGKNAKDENITIFDDVTTSGTYPATAITELDLSGVTGMTTLNKIFARGTSGNKTFSSMTKIVLPDCLTTLQAEAFRGTSNLETIIARGVTTIEQYAFYQCSGLVNLQIPKATQFGMQVFKDCDLLTELSFDNPITQSGYQIFDKENTANITLTLSCNQKKMVYDTVNLVYVESEELFDFTTNEFLGGNDNSSKYRYQFKDICCNHIGEDYTYSAHADEKKHNKNYTNCGDIIEENHDWEYSANGATILAECACGKTGSYTIEAPENLIYSAQGKEASVSGSIAGVEKPTLQYEGALEGGQCVNVGTYTASIILDETKATLNFTIEKAPLSVISVSLEDRAYNGLKEVTVTGIDLNGIFLTDEVNVDATKLKAAVSSADADTYNTVTLSSLSLTGNKAKNYSIPSEVEIGAEVEIYPESSVIIVEEGKETIAVEYGKTQIQLVGIGNTGDGSLVYEVESGNDVIEVTQDGKFATKKPGTATIAISMAATNNFEAAETKRISVTVNKAEKPETIPAASILVKNTVKKVSDIDILPEGWTFRIEDSIKALPAGDSLEVVAEYTAEDSSYYNITTKTIVITREACVEDETILYTGVGEKKATCEVAGKGHTECGICGDVMKKDVEIPAFLHDYEHTFTWAADGKSCTITFTCKNDKGHVVTFPCTVSSFVKVAATYSAKGVTSYLATYTKDGKTYTGAKEIADIPVLNLPAKGTSLKDANNAATYKVSEAGTTVEYIAPSNKNLTNITIPSTVVVNGVTYKVTSIANNAFKNSKKLKSVVIPSSITKIGKKAFYGCKKLKKITIKTKKLTAKKVGSKAFAKTHKKAVVKVPKKKWKAYKKFLYKKGISKKAKIKK